LIPTKEELKEKFVESFKVLNKTEGETKHQSERIYFPDNSWVQATFKNFGQENIDAENLENVDYSYGYYDSNRKAYFHSDKHLQNHKKGKAHIHNPITNEIIILDQNIVTNLIASSTEQVDKLYEQIIK
jgi:hypothetical protein